MAYSRAQINNDVIEIKDGRLYVNGHEVIKNGIDLKAQSFVSVGFIAGFMAGGFTCGFLALLFTGYFDV